MPAAESPYAEFLLPARGMAYYKSNTADSLCRRRRQPMSSCRPILCLKTDEVQPRARIGDDSQRGLAGSLSRFGLGHFWARGPPKEIPRAAKTISRNFQWRSKTAHRSPKTVCENLKRSPRVPTACPRATQDSLQRPDGEPKTIYRGFKNDQESLLTTRDQPGPRPTTNAR